MIQVVLDDAQSAGEHDHRTSEAIDKEIALENTEEHLQEAINAALQRIEQGTFGVCEDCGGKIAPARLEALPYTPYCIDCERIRETSNP
jgi:RNA polymerase-binding transcription factor DksA